MGRSLILDIFACTGVILILIFHLAYDPNSNTQKLFSVFVPAGFGQLGVLFFFFKSGYGLYHARKPTWGKFYKNRLIRIIPPLFLTTLLTVIFSEIIFNKTVFEPDGKFRLINFILTSLGVQAWFNVNSLNRSAWFVSVLLVFYLLFPIIYFLLEKKTTYVLVILAIFGIIFIISKLAYFRYIYYLIVFIGGTIVAKYNKLLESENFYEHSKKIFFIIVILYYLLISRYEHYLSAFPLITKVEPIIDVLVVLNTYYLFSNLHVSYYIKNVIEFISRYSYYIFLLHIPLFILLKGFEDYVTFMIFFFFLLFLFAIVVRYVDGYIKIVWRAHETKYN